MGWIRDIERLIKRLINAELVSVHTNLIGQVVSYDGVTNTCSVQPVQQRMRINDPDNLTTVSLPQLDEVPVKQFGSGKLLLSVAPKVGSYGEIRVSERAIENWLMDGGIASPGSPRKFDISDSVFDPGLYPLIEDGDNGLIASAIKTDRVELRTRSAKTSVGVIDDETLEIKNENATISLASSGAVTITSADVITTSGTETVIQDGTDYAVQYTAMASSFDDLKSELNALVTAHNAHIHITTATVGVGPPGVIAPTTSTGTPPVASMTGAKVAAVRMP